ncbi:putative chlorophyll binding protein [Tanacetum coccineum]
MLDNHFSTGRTSTSEVVRLNSGKRKLQTTNVTNVFEAYSALYSKGVSRRRTEVCATSPSADFPSTLSVVSRRNPEQPYDDAVISDFTHNEWILLPEALGLENYVKAPEWVALLGGQATYLGNPVPLGTLPTILAIEFISIAFVEHQRSMEKDLEKKKYPGGANIAREAIQELEKATQQRVADEKILRGADATFKERMLQLRFVREGREKGITDAVTKTSTKYEKIKTDLEEKLIQVMKMAKKMKVKNVHGYAHDSKRLWIYATFGVYYFFKALSGQMLFLTMVDTTDGGHTPDR